MPHDTTPTSRRATFWPVVPWIAGFVASISAFLMVAWYCGFKLAPLDKSQEYRWLSIYAAAFLVSIVSFGGLCYKFYRFIAATQLPPGESVMQTRFQDYARLVVRIGFPAAIVAMLSMAVAVPYRDQPIEPSWRQVAAVISMVATAVIIGVLAQILRDLQHTIDYRVANRQTTQQWVESQWLGDHYLVDTPRRRSW